MVCPRPLHHGLPTAYHILHFDWLVRNDFIQEIQSTNPGRVAVVQRIFLMILRSWPNYKVHKNKLAVKE